ncbi:hypothetical protein BJ912DRAFT_175933 [Pholiota molesta]|nr:hypothetical protein BJ912DRAFT_175933 [Pholiota molesta]
MPRKMVPAQIGVTCPSLLLLSTFKALTENTFRALSASYISRVEAHRVVFCMLLFQFAVEALIGFASSKLDMNSSLRNIHRVSYGRYMHLEGFQWKGLHIIGRTGRIVEWLRLMLTLMIKRRGFNHMSCICICGLPKSYT